MLKQYLPFFKAGAIKTINYRFNTFTWLLISVLQIVCIIFLWIGVYSSSPSGGDSVINGFTFKEMIVYVVFINIFNFVSFSSETTWEINEEIRNGTIANSYIKPISYRLRFTFQTLGNAFIQALIFGLPSFIIAYTIFLLLGFITIESIGIMLLNIFLFLVAQVLAILLMDSVNYICGILCFYTTASWGLNNLKNVIVSFLSGSLIPLAFFPGIFSNILSYSPFSGISQNPVLILMLKMDLISALKAIGLSLVWVIALELIAKLLFMKASKKITVQGG